jgi:hypothetical protein
VQREESFPFEDYPFDGILGLGPSALALPDTVPLFDSIISRQLLAQVRLKEVRHWGW